MVQVLHVTVREVIMAVSIFCDKLDMTNFIFFLFIFLVTSYMHMIYALGREVLEYLEY